ncbi:MAG: hypothetical protein HN712_19880 [Gemmatimonadetes bacterium]|nr:hypothetical protein [Gemmatimonadota bacterium]MBT7862584.1 hypothetical protein [Gemmatimonadota bacterium]
MQRLTTQDVDFFRDQGYLVQRGVFDEAEIGRLREGYDAIAALVAGGGIDPQYLGGQGPEVHIHVQAPEGTSGSDSVRYLRKVQWPAMLHPVFEEIRTSAKFPALLEPLIGTSLKQFINQINYKMPGGEISFPWHQDIRPTPAFRQQEDNYVQTIIVVDEATVANGCVHIVPESHRLGNLKVKRYADGQIEDHVDVSTAIPLEAAPGDVVMFTSYTVHGSTPNTTDRPRRSYINGFVRASTCDVGKWAFLEGKRVPITSDHDYHEISAALSRPARRV